MRRRGADIAALRKVGFVMQAGTVYRRAHRASFTQRSCGYQVPHCGFPQ
jgi:hypothetical protein